MEEASVLAIDRQGKVLVEAGIPLRNRIVQVLLIAAGTLFVGLGVLGIVLPVLPTTPFLLLAAACYLRSSSRLYRWLHTNRWFGKYLRWYRDGEGIPLASKIVSISLLWLSLGSSALFAVPERLWWVKLILGVIGLGVTIHLVHIRTRPRGVS